MIKAANAALIIYLLKSMLLFFIKPAQTCRFLPAV